MAHLSHITDATRRKIARLNNESLTRHLQQSLPFWVASVITGLAAVIYARLFAAAEQLALAILEWKWWVFLLLAPVLFWSSWWLVQRFGRPARGSGIPQVMAAIELATPKTNHLVSYLLSPRIHFIKIASSLLLVMGGGAIGREGPTIQIAGSVFRWVQDLVPASWPKTPKRNMIITGAAAGLAAAFNTPLGGIVFAVEELAKNHVRYFRTALFAAVIIAGLTAQAMLGPYLYLGYPRVDGLLWYLFFLVILVAAAAGWGGAIMSKIILKLLHWRRRFNTRQQLAYLFSGAMIMAAMGIWLSHLAIGSGKDLMTQTLFSGVNTPWYLPLARIVGPVASFTTGAAGGVFAPSLSAGASIGAVCAEWIGLSGSNANLLILAGMVGFLTGLTRSPFTSAILVLEMTDRHSVIFHLMLAALISNLAAYLIDRKSMYDHLKDDYLAEATAQDKNSPPLHNTDGGNNTKL